MAGFFNFLLFLFGCVVSLIFPIFGFLICFLSFLIWIVPKDEFEEAEYWNKWG